MTFELEMLFDVHYQGACGWWLSLLHNVESYDDGWRDSLPVRQAGHLRYVGVVFRLEVSV